MRKLLALLIVAIPAAAAAQTKLPPAATGQVSYEQQIKPLLSQNCYSCHGSEVQQSGLRLDLRQNALRGGDYGPVIIEGHSEQSKLIRRLVDGDGGLQMPPTGALTDQEIGLIRAWIDQGPDFRTEISDEAPAPKPIDPKLATLITAIRNGEMATVEALVVADPALVKATDAGGSTPLHHAAGFGTIQTMTFLLEHGADVNAKNRRLSTPLFWAIHDEAKVRLLLARGAAVNARQVEGRTPVYQAAILAGGLPVLRLLLAQGGDPKAATLVGQTPLMQASVRADTAAMLALIEKGADVNVKNGAGETALMSAASNGGTAAVRLLLDKGADATVKSKRTETALGNASTAGNAETVKLLLEHGAEVNVRNIRGYSPVMLAASSDAVPAGVVKLLLAKGADTSFSADYDENASILAAKRGHTEVSRLLGGAAPALPTRIAAVARDSVFGGGASGAVEKALALLDKASYNFVRTAGCNSCHSQDLPSAASGYARDAGIPAPKEYAQLPAAMSPPAERLMDLNFVNVTSIGWELFDLGMNHKPRTPETDAAVRYIKAMQTPQGSWPSNEGRRPPMNAGDFQGAALSVYALKHFAPQAEQATTDAVLANAVRWLESAKPATMQDRAFHLLALTWANASSASIKNAARALAAMQRADGGWSQMPTMVSDAYATGEALYALNVGGMPASNAGYRRGVDYLLKSQAPDGSWHVETRSIWLQPYFESGFPYARDQFISMAGTAWASMALTPVALAQSQPKKVSSR